MEQRRERRRHEEPPRVRRVPEEQRTRRVAQNRKDAVHIRKRRENLLNERVVALTENLNVLTVQNQVKQLNLGDSLVPEALEMRNRTVENIQERHRQEIEELRERLQQADNKYQQAKEERFIGNRAVAFSRILRAMKAQQHAGLELRAKNLEVQIEKAEVEGQIFDMFQKQ